MVRGVVTACLLWLLYVNLARAKLEKKYVLRNIGVNWYKAYQMCLAEGKKLATITSEEDNNIMRDMIKKIGSSSPSEIWISAADLVDEGTFYWMSTGAPVGYTNWAVLDGYGQQPDNNRGVEDCAHIWYHVNKDLERLAWNDADCLFKLAFVCEYYEDT